MLSANLILMKRIVLRIIVILAALSAATPTRADDHRQTVVAFSLRLYDVQLHWKNGTEQFWSLNAVRQHLVEQGRCPVFLSNGGIYGKDYAPLGLHIEDGTQIQQVNPAKGSGNFSWNSAIFSLRDGRPEVRRHTAWPGDEGVSIALQSGPALVLNGKRTSAGRSEASRYSRGAVVAYRDGRVGFVQTLDRIAFRDLVNVASTRGQIQGMLYLDGRINDWWERGKERPARGFPWFAGILSVSRKGYCPDPLKAPTPKIKPVSPAD